MPKKRGGSRHGAYEPVIFAGTNGRTKRGSAGRATRSGQAPVQVIVRTDERVPQLPSATPHVSKGNGDRRRHKSWVGQLPITVTKFAWKHRWPLAPVAAWLTVFVTTAHVPWLVLMALSVLAIAARFLAETDATFGKRKFLSKNERMTLFYWSCAANGAVIVELLSGGWAWQRFSFTLMIATSYPTYRWWTSRKPERPKGKLSKETAAYLALWSRVSQFSDGTLKGSTVVSGTAHEPSPGTLVFTAQLRADVHGKKTENQVVWRAVEALLGLPPDTVRIKCDKNVSTRAKVTMSASRHLETNVVAWPHPELTPDGAIKLGTTPSGQDVDVPRADDKGVKHGRVSGNTGNGKSTTARVVLLACASAKVRPTKVSAAPDGLASTPDDLALDAPHEEIIWLIDGKRGTSVPEIRNVFDWYATTDDEWPLVLDTLYATLMDRQLRRGKAGLSAWRRGKETDPLIRLYIAEASAVRRSLQGRGLAKRYDKIVLELLQHGRALGISVWQESQDAIAENWLGGRQARELMSKGAAIMHRPGGSTGQQYAGDGSKEKMRLLNLPEAEGFAAVVINGSPAADVMRVRWCDEEAARAWAAGYYPRALDGADLKTVGAPYLKRTRGRQDAAEMRPELPKASGDDDSHVITLLPPRAPARVEAASRSNDNDNDSDNAANDVAPLTAEEVSTTVDWVYKMLMFNPTGLSVEQLVERGGGKRGRSAPNIYKCLARLREQELVEQDGTVYVAIRGGTK